MEFTCMSPLPSGLTLTVSLNVLPGQPALAGFVISTEIVNTVSARTNTDHGRMILSSFFMFMLPSIRCYQYQNYLRFIGNFNTFYL
jgi:hypothetical protein